MLTPASPVLLRPEREPERSVEFVGMVIFLGSWAILFAALFFSFGFFRVSSSDWPPDGAERLPTGLPCASTVVLIASERLLGRAYRDLRDGLGVRYRTGLIAALMAGVAFVLLQLGLLAFQWTAGVQLATHLYASYFYLLTGFHGLHAMAGVVLMAMLVPEAMRPQTPARPTRVKMVTMFWQFVGVAWVLTFLLVFL